MAAIPVKHTAVDTTSSWDKAKVVAETEAELRYVSAWVDGSADATLKGSYKFPHHYKDGGPAILAGVNNAKARLSQAQIPDADRAGVLAHLNAHQKDAKQSILQTIKGWFDYWFADNEEREVVEQAISMPNIYQLVGAALNQDEQAPYRGLVDVYLDGPQIFAVISQDGLLYRSDVTLVNGGVTLGPLTQVVVDYKPAAQTIKTTRQADGKYRWFAFPAATAVLNRSGELDTRQLFENFVKRIEAEEVPYPFLSFYHVGQAITLGQADYVAVDGYTLLMSGVWDDAPLATATRQAIEAHPDYYGISIGYMYAPETKQELKVGEGITIPVYTDGILVECSILAEKDAACLFTGAYTEGVNRMNKKAKDELEKIVAGDPILQAQVAELEQKVDSVNASTEGLIRRESTEAAPTEPTAPVVEPVTEVAPVETAPAEPVAPVTEPAASPEFVLDDTAMDALADKVSRKVGESFTEQFSAMKATHEQAVNDLNAIVTKLTERIAKLEAPLEETVKQALKDMPRNQKVTGIYRPTQKTQAVEPVASEETSLGEIAQETLAKLH